MSSKRSRRKPRLPRRNQRPRCESIPRKAPLRVKAGDRVSTTHGQVYTVDKVIGNSMAVSRNGGFLCVPLTSPWWEKCP